jgi:hypothetical protein
MDHQLPPSRFSPNILWGDQTLDQLLAERAYWDEEARTRTEAFDLQLAAMFRDHCDEWIARRKAEAARAAMRPIECGEIEGFILDAIKLAVASGRTLPSGVAVTSAARTEQDSFRVDLSDGSFFFLDIEHLVPRDYFQRPAQ